jgi:polyisoprenoid-binding protein YceI
LKSADFFDAANHPQLTFASNKLVASGDGYEVHGDLTIRGTTKPVVLNAEFGGIAADPWGAVRAGFELTGEVNRKEFGLQWDAVTEAGSIVVAEAVKLNIHVEMVKQ